MAAAGSLSPVVGVNGTALFHDSNGSGTLDATDELIATFGTAFINASHRRSTGLDILHLVEPKKSPTIFCGLP